MDTADAEIARFMSHRDAASASVALEGLLGYLNAVHNRTVVLTLAQNAQLITAQAQGRAYTPDRVARALQIAGSLSAGVGGVQTASAAERVQLPDLADSGATLSPFEGLLIAADSSDVHGFQLEQKALNIFLQQLLGK